MKLKGKIETERELHWDIIYFEYKFFQYEYKLFQLKLKNKWSDKKINNKNK